MGFGVPSECISNRREISPECVCLSQLFAGIGLSLRCISIGGEIVKIEEDSPATISGNLKVGDTIVQVDRVDLKGLKIGQIEALVKGPPGTLVELGVINCKTKEFRRQILEREEMAGVGVRLCWDGDDLIFTHIGTRGQAWKAGVCVGDVLVSVDGGSVKGLSQQ